MTQVRSRDPSFSTTPILTGFGSIVGSFTDDRSIAMRLASTSTSSSTNDHPLPTYNYHHHHRRSSSFNDPPDGPQSPGPSSPSSSPPPPCTPSVPKLMAIHSVQSATGSLAEWGDSGTDRLNGAVKPLVEELQHASEMSGENSVTESHRSGTESDGSLTRVDVGWRVFRHDVITPRSWWLRVLNVVYPVLVVLLLLYTYMYEMIACEWKLNVVKDTKVRTPKPPPTTITTPIGNYTDNETTTGTSLPKALLFNFSPTQEENLTSPTLSPSSSTPPPCDHIITTYLIPNVLHFAAYVMGMYYFRIQDNEQMYALMEKVFLQANPQHTSSSSQQKLVYKTRLFLALGSVWVLATLGLQVLYVWVFSFPALDIFERFGEIFHWVTLSIELVGRVVFNSVILAIVVNYATQCEMVMFYVKGLSLRLQEKSTDIKTAFKDTWLLRQNLSLLNGVISKMTSLALTILAELTVIGVSILILNQYDTAEVWVYRGIFPVVWGVMLGFPLFQAARVNSVCLRIKKSSLEMRVFGYKNSSQLELDSFLQFVHATRLRAKLFHVPIQPSYLMALCILAAFVFLLLVQTTSIFTRNNLV
ncbi:uncharacterized protein LOC143275355 isoform X2 [Babylonia areolata]|uniref:uncharacterized protein LOC143275355 isoform X2 n=1 Tax=Babylonia areolata TaxID=304850 RepID=UPI003FD1E5EE